CSGNDQDHGKEYLDHLSVDNLDKKESKELLIDELQSVNSNGENKAQLFRDLTVNENGSTECLSIVNLNYECVDIDNSSSSSSTNCDINNKRQSSKPNTCNKFSPTSDKSVSSNKVTTPAKDSASNIDKDKLREESAKIRESLFSVNTCSAKSLSGYKIPKKLKTDTETTDGGSLQNKRGSSTVSPLSEVCQQTQVGTYSVNGYHTDRNQRWQGNRNGSGKNHNREQKLILKLRKDPGYSNAGRWHSNTNVANRTDAFNANGSPAAAEGSHCEGETTLPAESHSRPEREFENRTNLNNSGKYLPRLKKFSQKGQNGDYWVSYA
ncbi:uncharacterized protein, partial [Centruroides vittatus]|uniref:uncharacterized protein n=1 Tax=Centruroides vittatus TaxID=120091 RepID=UPI00350F28AC